MDKKKRKKRKMSFQHNLWAFMWFYDCCRLYQSLSILSQANTCIRTLPFPKYTMTSSPSHSSLLIGAKNIKKRTCSYFFSSLLSFFHFLSRWVIEFQKVLWLFFVVSLFLLVNGFSHVLFFFWGLKMHLFFSVKLKYSWNY